VPELAEMEIEGRMRPGAFPEWVFGADESLTKVLDEDRAEMSGWFYICAAG